MNKAYVLIGFMGAGKTTVGRELAHRTGLRLIDTDQMIVKAAGKPVTDIFAQDGEEAFRTMETNVLKKLQSEFYNAVISCGGGLPLREENRQLLKSIGTVILLDVSAEEVIRRLSGDTTRPLLAGEHPEEKVRALLSARETHYRAAADVTITVDDKNSREVAAAVLDAVKAFRAN